MLGEYHISSCQDTGVRIVDLAAGTDTNWTTGIEYKGNREPEIEMTRTLEFI